MRVALLLLLALAMAAATALAGWWAVPLVAAVCGVLCARRPGAALDAGLAASLGWALLLAREAARGPVAVVAVKTAAVMGLPSAALVALALIYPFLLAWAAARLAISLARAAGPGRPAHEGPERDAGRGEIPAARSMPAASDAAEGITARS